MQLSILCFYDDLHEYENDACGIVWDILLLSIKYIVIQQSKFELNRPGLCSTKDRIGAHVRLDFAECHVLPFLSTLAIHVVVQVFFLVIGE